ncbi:hypothetical protein [Bacillus chungangensis]|uniref:YrzI family protein n=1 Tax=Bacillus chungangensis TaxID=587633 RepID=A0ABT9WRX3_9BACI|nr:hypothetical protein [Bacillus chungangensis]MDQ0176036.1 hypothetical protein [Bacillus chungangensis]
MKFLFCASRLMTAAEVRERCKEARENRDLLLALEIEIRHQIYLKNKKAAS